MHDAGVVDSLRSNRFRGVLLRVQKPNNAQNRTEMLATQPQTLQGVQEATSATATRTSQNNIGYNEKNKGPARAL